MDLTTRCPHCGTVFQVGLQDLQLRKGYIRCVQCAHIFDGYAEVVSEPTHAVPERVPMPSVEPAARPVIEPAIEPRDGFDKEPTIGRVAASAPLAAPQVFRSSRENAEPQFTVGNLAGPAASDWRAEGARQGASQVPPIIVEPHPARASYGGSAAPLLRGDEGAGPLERLGRWFVVALVALGAVLLLVQIAYVYRAQIALTFPVLRPALIRACGPLQCQIPYARDLSQLAITGSDLKLDSAVHDTGAGAPPRHFILHINLRNRALQPQEWPSIVLDLNDAAGVRLVRRNLSPREYLTPQLLAGPFAPNSEVRVQVPITLNDIQINGYQLDLFFS